MPAAPIAAGGGQLTPGFAPPLQGPGDRIAGPRTPAYGPTLPVPGPGAILPLILTPGVGPNGPGPIDARAPVAPTKYAAAGSQIVNANGVWGILGPPADSLRKPTLWYIRATGSNNNGGTSTSAAGDRTGSDGVTNGTATFTSASAAFTSADIGKGICINTGANARRHRIIAVASATSITLDRTSSNASGLAWVIGGAWADWRAAFGDAAVTAAADINSPVRTGDTIYMGAQTQRVVVSIGTNWIPTYDGILSIVGDVTGQFTGDAGMVAVSAYVTDDKTAPSGTALFTTNVARHGLSFNNIFFVGGTGALLASLAGNGQNWTFRDCAIIEGGTASAAGLLNFTALFGTPLNITIDRCDIIAARGAGGVPLTLTFTTGAAGNDYDGFVYLTNSRIWALSGNAAFFVTNSGTLTFKGNGLHVRNCLFIGPVITMSASQLSTIFPSTITGSYIYSGGVAPLVAGTTGQLVEDYNVIVAGVPRTLVSAGAHSISDGSYAPLFHFGQERIWLPPMFRPFGEPMASSPLLAFGGDGSATPYDWHGPQNLRPAGGGNFPVAVGAMERADTFVADASPIGSGGSPVKLTGPGYNDFLLPIQAAEVGQARTVSVKVKFDASYAGTLPEMLLIAKPQMGVAGQTVAAVGAPGNVLTITLAAFTPSAVGVLNIRLVSLDLSGASVVEWDDFTIT